MSGKKYSIEFMLGAGLESNFAKSFNTAANSMKELQEKANLISRYRTANTTKGVRDDLSRTRQAMILTQNAATKMSNMIGTAFAAAGGIYLGYKAFAVGKDVIKSYADFEQGMQNVKALSGATSEELAQLTQKAKELNASTKFDGVQVAEGMGFLAMAGYKTNDILAAMPGLLAAAAAGGEELGVTADITSNILQGFGIATEETGRVADVLTKAFTSSNVTMGMIGETMKYVAPQSKAAGISLEETAAAAGILGNAGIQASMAGTGLRSIIARMAAPTGKAATLMKQLGISAVNSDGSLKSLADTIESVSKGTAHMGEAERISTVKLLAGQYAASSMLTLMDVGADQLRDFTNELENSTGEAQRIADEQMNSLAGSFEYATSVINAAKVAIGEKFAPSIRKMAETIKNQLPSVIDQFEATWAAMTNNPTWQNADWLGKFQIAWDKLISSPFRAWWQSQGKSQFEKVAGEIGKVIKASIGGVVKEAFTGSGATQLLAAGAIAIPAINTGRGILNTASTIKSLLPASAAATQGVTGATKAVGLFGPALGLLTNPLGLAAAGVGALTLGVIAYKKHQENARQALINMGDSVSIAYDNYQVVSKHTAKVKDLVDEYDQLKTVIDNAATPTDELEQARTRLLDVEQQLIDLNPDILKAEDAKTDKFREQLGYAQQLREIDLEYAKRDLEKNYYDNQKKLPDLQAEYNKLTTDAEKYEEAYNQARESMVKYREFVSQKDAILNNRSLDSFDIEQKLDALLAKLNEATGKTYSHWAGVEVDLGKVESAFDSNYEKWKQTSVDISAAEKSLQAIYDNAKAYIEIDLGGSIESLAEKFPEMSEEGKKAFIDVLKELNEYQKGLDQLPNVKTVQVQTIFDQVMGYTYIPQQERKRYNIPTLDQYADGGFANKPSIFGEAGLEAAIPINNKPRSHAILDQVNRMMGHDVPSVNQINVAERFNRTAGSIVDNTRIEATFAPQVTIQGNADDSVIKQLEQALEGERERFETWLKEFMRQEGRLAFK